MSVDILFLGDSWETLDHQRDSTLHLGTFARDVYGARTYWALADGVFLQDGKLYILLTGEIDDSGLRPESVIREFKSFHSVHWRADPPVTLATMRLWSLLAASGGEKGVPFVNSPDALLTWNEKFAPLRFREWAIPGIAADSECIWKRFFDSRQSGVQLIAKPAGDAASRGVELLPATWDVAAQTLSRMRAAHGPWIIIQEFDRTLLTEGETRVFVLGAQICAAINKRPNPRHPIMNLDTAPEERPQLSVTSLSSEQLRRANAIAQELAAEGVYLATIDFIGERVLEINITSPGLIKWLDERLPPAEQIGRKYWRGLMGS